MDLVQAGLDLGSPVFVKWGGGRWPQEWSGAREASAPLWETSTARLRPAAGGHLGQFSRDRWAAFTSLLDSLPSAPRGSPGLSAGRRGGRRVAVEACPPARARLRIPKGGTRHLGRLLCAPRRCVCVCVP